MSAPVLLIADSAEARCRDLAEQLCRSGFQVIEAASAAEALASTARCHPAMVLLSGESFDPALQDLVPRLRALPSAPLILSLAHADSPVWEGADIYLREPAPHELVATIATCIRLLRTETELKEAQRVAGVGSWAWEVATGTITWSDELFRIYGQHPATLILSYGEHLKLYVPESRARLSDAVERALTHGEPYELELELVRPDGTTRWIACRGVPQRDGRGRIIGLQGTGQDITERKRMEETLRNSEERLRFILSCTQAGAWELDLSTGTFIFSDGIYSMFGFDRNRAKLTEADWFARMHPDDRAWLEPRWEAGKQMETGQVSVEYRIIHPERGVRWINGWAGLERDEAGRLIRVGGISFDITDRKRTEEALRRSEERLRFILDCSRAGAWELDLQTGTYNLSDGMYSMFGIDRNSTDLGEADWLALMHPDDRGWIKESWLDAKAHVEGQTCVEYRIIHSELGVRWTCGWAGFERDEAGKLVRVGGINFDITERKRTEEALRTSEANFRQLVEIAQEGIWMVDALGRTEYANQRMAEMLGCALQDLLGHPVFEFTFEEDREAAIGLFRQCLAGNRMQLDFRLRRPDGDELWAGISANRIMSDSGELRGVLALFSDVTERRRAEQALREADRRKDEFLAMLAHELRNPLAPIRNAVQIMRDLDRGDTATLDWVREVIDRQVGHLGRLVDDLLDVSRLVRGSIELRKEIVDLVQVVEWALVVARPLIQNCRHVLVVSLPAEALWLDADPTRLTQVLENLLTNAAKYTPPGGCIWLEAGGEDGQAVIRVRDNGMGIPADLQPQVFELFTQGRRSLDRSQGGLGIGLTIVKSLVEKHGGTISVRSNSGGSEFTVRLPLSRVRTDGVRQVQGDAGPRPVGTAHRILVVDDNEDARNSLGLLLELEGHRIAKATDGPTALALAVEFRPELVLLDIGLPGMDGYEVARRLREEPKARDALLVAVTGYGQSDDKCRAEAAGFDRHLVKPVDPDVLGRILAQL
jgi:PAS domain S-box-containing protein